MICMKKKNVIIGIVIGLIICCTIILVIIYGKVRTEKSAENNVINNEQISESKKDAVIIKNGNIENENLIDEFINSTKMESINTAVLSILEYDDTNNYKEIKIEYIPGNYAKRKKEDNTNVTIISTLAEDNHEQEKEEYGYYKLTKDGETSEFPLDRWWIKRYSNKEQVKLYFDTSADVIYFPDICSYNLKSSNYKSKFELTYLQRKDMGLDKIFQDEISLYAFGGDVNITIENDMVYDLKTALETKVITIDDILEQVKMDEKYGVCDDIGMYNDGGSVEYYYNNYTILKYDSLSGKKDIVIGFRGTIINQVNDILYHEEIKVMP